ncbi:MAG: hypothetical protein WCY88_17290 [Spongiibacteraceae bacterium]
MSTMLEIWEGFKGPAIVFYNEAIAQLPNIVSGLLVLLLGWLVARLVRFTCSKLLNALNNSLEHLVSGGVRGRFSTELIRLVAALLFWVTLFIFTASAMRIAGFIEIAEWLGRLVDYLPSLMTGCIIILAGYVLSSLVRDASLAATRSLALAEAELISRLVQVITFVTALIIGMSQLGLDVTFLTTVIGVSIAAVLTGFALAFGIGARTLVSNLIAAHYIRELLEPGQQVRIGEWQGAVLRVTATTVILDTPEGRTSLPAKFYQEQAVLVLIEDPVVNE